MMDVRYLDRASIWTDFQILFLTIGAVLRRTGA